MKLDYTPKFKSSLKKFAPEIQEKLAKQTEFLVADIRHPSLHAKKYHEKEGIWQARVDRRCAVLFFNSRRHVCFT